MNANQANNLDFPDLLSRMGFEPTAIKKQGKELWYCSPLRPEKEPSFHVSKGQKYAWVWNDFGDTGGTIIDFIMSYQGHRNLKQSLDYLKSFYPNKISVNNNSRVGELSNNFFSSHSQGMKELEHNNERELEFIKAGKIKNPIIYSYLCKDRAIPRQLVDKYIQEIRYRNKKTNKEFFAFGIENQSGGYEIRAASDAYKFKSALKIRDITIIKGFEPQGKSVNIVEGMADFLSLFAMYNTTNLKGDTIVMHSLSSYSRTVDFIKAGNYDKINTFLDNNTAGKKHSEQFKLEFGDKVAVQSGLFEPYEDLNDALQANQRTENRGR